MSIAPIGVPVAPEVPDVTGVEHAAPRVDLAGSFGKALEGNVRPIRPAAPPADLEGAVAALARREPAATPSAITAAAPATAVTSAAATASARSGLASAALTPLEQAVHDLVEQLSGHRSRHAPGPLADQ